MYIYIATNIINKKQYVGQSMHPPHKQRIHDHKKAKTGTTFHDAIRQHGLENFIWRSIPYLGSSKESLDAIEHWYITKLNTLTPHGYNTKDKSKDSKSKSIQQTSESKKQRPAHNRSDVWEHQSEVINLYKNGYSCPEIANELKSSPNIILNILKKNNVPIRSHSETLTGRPAHNRSTIWEIQPEIINLYKKGYSCREIAEKFNVSSTTIGNILEKNSIPRRSPKEAKNTKFIRQLFK